MQEKTQKVFEFEKALIFYNNPDCKIIWQSYKNIYRRSAIYYCRKVTSR